MSPDVGPHRAWRSQGRLCAGATCVNDGVRPVPARDGMQSQPLAHHPMSNPENDRRSPEEAEAAATPGGGGVSGGGAGEPADNGNELERLRLDLERFRDLAIRSQADFENFRKRSAREKEEAMRHANAELLHALLPILDSLELGLDAARRDPAAAAIVAGMEMVGRQLADLLGARGVTPVDAVGSVFDPRVHEALAQENDAGVPEGHVIRQVRRGYRLHERLLRPATVIVSLGPPAAGGG